MSDRWQYEAFGGLLHQTGSTANPHRFTGERWSSDLGLSYLRARWYHQGTGRFLTMDTYPGCNTDPLSLHKYIYAHNDPGNKIDPSGLMAESALQLNAVVLPTKVVVETLGVAVACVLTIQATAFMAGLSGQQIIGITLCRVQTKKKTCSSEYPHLRTCSFVESWWNANYRHRNIGLALQEISPHASRHRTDPATGGPCPGRWGGTHISTRVPKGGNNPSIGCCPCCVENNGNPRKETRCAVLWRRS
ncbi:MAG: RHS repeat-associated core domain-containing protein [Chloroflexaceae bacterium]|nr:RHS repeat-associated core domain-containing protein [Chloroflexaceae bacterium]